MKLRVYRLDRGPNWYLFLSPRDLIDTVTRLKLGEAKLTISEMTGEQFCKEAAPLGIEPADHLDRQAA